MTHQVAARVPPETYVLLRALTAVLQTSQADVLERALTALERSLTPAKRELVRLLRAQQP